MPKLQQVSSAVVQKILSLKESGLTQTKISEILLSQDGITLPQPQISKILRGVGVRSFLRKKKRKLKSKEAKKARKLLRQPLLADLLEAYNQELVNAMLSLEGSDFEPDLLAQMLIALKANKKLLAIVKDSPNKE